MKRQIKDVKSAGAGTPLPTCLGKKCRQDDGCGLAGFGTPVEGLTGMPVDTPESQQRQAAIPDTTQRKLEGFCLNTPLTLSQAQAAETPTLVGGTTKGKAVQEQQLSQQASSTGARHRLANISNVPLPASAARAAAAAAAADSPGGSCDAEVPGSCADVRMTQAKSVLGRHRQSQEQQPRSPAGQPQQLRGKRHMQVSFRASLLSPPATLPGPRDPDSLLPSGLLCQTPWPPAAAAAAACPGSAGASEDGFVLHTSQSYSRASQPAISPSVAAGLSAPAEEEEEEEDEEEQPFTTPSQDSREPPRQSPSNVTGLSNAASDNAFEQPLALLPMLGAAAAAAGRRRRLPASAAAGKSDPGAAGPSRFGSNTSTDDVFVLLPEAAGGAAAAAAAAATPGEGLALLLGDLDETTTPELEQIGLASQECGSQFSAGAAAAAAGGGGRSSRGAAAGAAVAAAPAAAAAGGRAAGGRAAGGRAAGGVVLEEVTAKQVLFPIFRPKSTRKCVILVRHGESTYNKQDAVGKHWSDPHIFDAPLTQKGRMQAIGAHEAVQKQLDKVAHLGAVLWLSSPLTRALETMTLACPDVERIAQQQQQGGSRVVILSTISEHCFTAGDVGLPASELAQRWPSFAPQLAGLQEQWWHNPEPVGAPNCALKRVFSRSERLDDMRHRVSEFTRWLGAQPEQVVVAFGHSTFWKYFTNSKSRMKNCEVRQLMW